MRATLAKYLEEIASNNKSIIFLTADLGFGVFDNFRKKFPNRYLNVGIAEAGMVSVATGLASKGFIPIVYSIASFLIPKTYEQVKLLSVYNENKIILIGAGGGLAYSMSGPTHHSLDDLSLAYLIPNMNVYAPSGPKALITCLSDSINSSHSSYIQIGKFGEPNNPNFMDLDNSKVGLISIGIIANDVYNIYKKLLSNGIEVGFLTLKSIRPLDKRKILKFVSQKKKIIVIEESWGPLSLYSILTELFFQEEIDARIIRIGPPHKILSENLERSTRLNSFGLNYKSFFKMLSSK